MSLLFACSVLVGSVMGIAVQWPMQNDASSTPALYAGQLFSVTTDGNSAIFVASSESYMEVPYYSALNSPTFSVALWVLVNQDPNVNGQGTVRTLLTSRLFTSTNVSQSTRGYSVGLTVNNQFQGVVGRSQAADAWFSASGGSICTGDGCFDHVVWQCSPTACELWVNTVPYVAGDIPGSAPMYLPNTVNPLRIGASTGTAGGCASGGAPSYCNGFTGDIKNVRFNSVFLTPTQIANYVAQGPDQIPALSAGAIVGVFFAVTFAIAILGLCGAFFLRRWKKEQVMGLNFKLDD